MKKAKASSWWISRIAEAVKIRNSGVALPGVLRVYGKRTVS